MVKIRHSLGRFRCRLKPGFLSDRLSVYLASLEGRGYAGADDERLLRRRMSFFVLGTEMPPDTRGSQR